MSALPVASLPDFADRTVGEIAATLPGATGVFRRHKLDFCCGGTARLEVAARDKGLDLAALIAELQALSPDDDGDVPADADALIDHILERYHEVHRRELPELLRLAVRVEKAHVDHPEVPAGIAAILRTVAEEMEDHLQKEEQILFPLMRSGGHPMIGQPISVMRHEHDGHGENLRKIAELANDFEAPADACNSWRGLYAGLRKFTDDLMMHIHLENNILFPRFGA
jgi:regulator of cell morphogenesis and NO signaling